MKYTNSAKSWRINEDGSLRVTCTVLAQGIFKYLPSESPDGAEVHSDGMVYHYIPKSAFTLEALASLEGVPVTAENHLWRDTKNTFVDGNTVGTVAGTPEVFSDYVLADVVVRDEATIEAIKRGDLVEVSAGYDATCTLEHGLFAGESYEVVQDNIRFNHLTFLPKGQGRCGEFVKIINSEDNMKEKVIQKQFGNKSLNFKFTNEADADEALKLADETQNYSAEEVSKAMETVKLLTEEKEKLQADLDEALKVLEQQKELLEKLTSEEAQTRLAEEAMEQIEHEEHILDEMSVSEKEEVQKELANCKSFYDRRKLLVCNRLKVSATELSGKTKEFFDGAFAALSKAPARVKTVENKANSNMLTNSYKENLTNLQRILKASGKKRSN